MKAKIFEIKRFAVHDGDGIRTTVFFKGCPLKCVWCHNPEGISFENQIAYYDNKCTGCGQCIDLCPSNAHKITHDGHIFDKSLCSLCGKCSEECPGQALKLYGKETEPKELLELLLEDKDFYDNSKGGVTLSGGECLMQADFCALLLKLLKENGINTAVDTCGFVPREAIDKVLPFVDVFLYDIKAFDEDVHIKCTGRSNKIIIENLKYIDSKDRAIEIRIPYVPGYNHKEIPAIAELVNSLKNVCGVRILPYHSYAGSKYESLGMENTLPDNMPKDEEIKKAEGYFEKIIH